MMGGLPFSVLCLLDLVARSMTVPNAVAWLKISREQSSVKKRVLK